MKLKELILEILKRGEKFKSREIARRASILDQGMPYTKDDVKEVIFNELKHIVNYDNLTYEYYIINKISKSNPISNKDLILETLKINEVPMTLIDISNYIRYNYKKKISIDDILIIILKDLRYEVGIDEGKLVKYFLR
ncbi:MAG: hypothetical protein NTY55_00810 [Flavobacteriia bacterium]|nr:hypothetical protein [Flavobacteriia bacterium]